MSIEIRRNSERYLTEGDGKSTRHSFSYGAHYDPDNVGFGPIRAINTEHLEPGAGYPAHRHSDVEIVTWVTTGELTHEDSAGGGGVINPGTVQRLSAGDGAEHTEWNDSPTEPLEFIQMMLASDRVGEPEYVSVDLPDQPERLLETVPVHAPAELRIATLRSGGPSVVVPASPRCLVHVARGNVILRDELLETGDEARLTGAGRFDLTAAAMDAQVLVWLID